MAMFEYHLALKQEETDTFEDRPRMETFICSLCGFKFSQERYLTNHFNLCKNIENPSKLGQGPIDPLKCESVVYRQCKSPKEEEQSAELLDQKSTSDPLFDIKIELELDFTETISDSSGALSLQPVDIFKTADEPTQFEDRIKVKNSPEKTHKSTKSGLIPARYRFLKTYKRRHTKTESRKVGVGMRTVETPLNCEICDYSSTRRDHFRQHNMLKHTGAKPFNCEICDYSSSNRASLQQHMLNHRAEVLFFNCEICNYCSTSRDDLQRHMLEHKRRQPFNCEICNFASKRRDHFQQHMLKHTAHKTFNCEICEFSSTRYATLRRHILTHSLAKPFKCEICDYSSKQRDLLQQHMLKHTGERQFNCDICDYTSARRHHFDQHMLKHTDEKKTFNCKICDYSGPRCEFLQRHMLTHTVEKLFM